MKYGKYVYLAIRAIVYGYFEWQGYHDQRHVLESVFWASGVVVVTLVGHYAFAKDRENKDTHILLAAINWLMYATVMVEFAMIFQEHVRDGYWRWNIVWVIGAAVTISVISVLGKEEAKAEKSKCMHFKCKEVSISCR